MDVLKASSDFSGRAILGIKAKVVRQIIPHRLLITLKISLELIQEAGMSGIEWFEETLEGFWMKLDQYLIHGLRAE